MKRLILILAAGICPGFFLAQLTIRVASVPANTPPDDTVYIAGNFNNWNPGHVSYILSGHQDGTYSITFQPNPGQLQYKFTRGSWATVEGNASGGFIPNRTYPYSGGIDTVIVTIAGWEGNSGAQHTATDNVQILDEDFFIPQLNRSRRIWIYLPPDYDSTSKRYPVIYMQDGQNLFDAYYSFAGEWKIDESMNLLFDQGDYGAIVVGIDNGGAQRINEYSPWINPSYGGGAGEAYAGFLTETLKPYIDDHFRTLTGREHTAIAGSSLGANISMYAAVEYQDVFGKVGIFSPAFWFSDSCYLHVAEKGISHDLKVYFVASHNESASMIANMMAMYDALVQAGQDENGLYFVSHTDGAHSEWYWAREYPAAYSWLFSDPVAAGRDVRRQTINLYPNPAGDHLNVETTDHEMTYTVYSPEGRRVIPPGPLTSTVDTSSLAPGLYFLEIRDSRQKAGQIIRFVKH